MKSIVKSFAIILLLGAFFTSCRTTKTLSDSTVFQKRKYTKGYHVNLKKRQSVVQKHSVTASAFETLNPSENGSKVSRKALRPIETTKQEPTLVIASATADSRNNATEKVRVRKTNWVKNITLPVLVNEIFSKPPEGYVEKPAPAGAIIGFIASIVGVFIAGIPLGLLGIILCGVAIGKIERNPGMRGKGLAIAGIIIGVVAIVGALIVISNM